MLSAAQFPLVTSTKVLRDGISEEVEVKIVHDQALDTLPSIATNTLETSNEVHAFIYCQCFPDQVLLIALAEEFSHGL